MMERRWIILRTSGRHTLRLADTLAEDGFEVWTPRETTRLRPKHGQQVREVTLPIMPSYVFARADGLHELLQLADMPVKPRRYPLDIGADGKRKSRPAHHAFNVMRFHDSIPMIADAHLQSLRRIEERRAPKKKALAFAKGMTVKVMDGGGSFTGMKGVVRRSGEATTLLLIDRRMKVEIPTFLLRADELRKINVAASLAA